MRGRNRATGLDSGQLVLADVGEHGLHGRLGGAQVVFSLKVHPADGIGAEEGRQPQRGVGPVDHLVAAAPHQRVQHIPLRDERRGALDDGFQHLALQRDVNLVLFNADRLAGNSRVFPGGELREPVSALSRATAFVLTAVNDKNRNRAERFAELLNRKFPQRPVYLASYNADAALQLQPDGACAAIPLDIARQDLADCAFAFCGIAGPASFFNALAALPLELKGVVALPDHHVYTVKNLQQLCRQAENSRATALITTEKDLVKISPLAAHLPLPLYALRMRAALDEQFTASLLQAISR